MISIDQLLESVDLDFEPGWVTKDENGEVCIFENAPETCEQTKQWVTTVFASGLAGYEGLKLAEFENKPWQECIYEVPRKDKPVVKIEKLNLLNDSALLWGKKINELVAAVNELKGAKNE